ncbi:hypothetical protein GL297_09495 [Komagataeibacter sp. FXV2]|nr:hypothetical protein [Komagataeibacter sp. FXV2]GCE81158.1 hypothetical protein MSKU3_2633 [Komagataeibacter oboediens]
MRGWSGAFHRRSRVSEGEVESSENREMSSFIHFLNLKALQHYWNIHPPVPRSLGTMRPVWSHSAGETEQAEQTAKQPQRLQQRERPHVAVGLVLMLLFGMASPASAHAPHDVLSCETEKQPVNIPSMPLDRAIEILGRQTGCPVLVDPVLMDGRTSAAVKGAYTPPAALLHLFGSVHVDVTATVSGLNVSPLDATALTSGDKRAGLRTAS